MTRSLSRTDSGIALSTLSSPRVSSIAAAEAEPLAVRTATLIASDQMRAHKRRAIVLEEPDDAMRHAERRPAQISAALTKGLCACASQIKGTQADRPLAAALSLSPLRTTFQRSATRTSSVDVWRGGTPLSSLPELSLRTTAFSFTLAPLSFAQIPMQRQRLMRAAKLLRRTSMQPELVHYDTTTCSRPEVQKASMPQMRFATSGQRGAGVHASSSAGPRSRLSTGRQNRANIVQPRPRLPNDTTHALLRH